MIQSSSNRSVTTSGTSTQAVTEVTGGMKRTQLIITNTSAAAVVTIAKGDTVAVAGVGIRLQPNSAYVEATDGGYVCWQGNVQVVSDVAGSVAVVESFVE
jgi:hypothetical protein